MLALNANFYKDIVMDFVARYYNDDSLKDFYSKVDIEKQLKKPEIKRNIAELDPNIFLEMVRSSTPDLMIDKANQLMKAVIPTWVSSPNFISSDMDVDKTIQNIYDTVFNAIKVEE